MGPMMGGSPGWDPVLIVLVILGVVVILAAVALAFALRSAGPVGTLQSYRRGRRDRDSRRYARGEISHAEFIRVLDQLLRAEQDTIPSIMAKTAGETGSGDTQLRR